MRSTHGCRSLYTVADLAGDRSISRMSPWWYDSHLTIVPGDRDRIPTHLSDCAAISGSASPINTAAFLEAFRFSDCHCCGSHCLLTLTQLQCSSCYAGRFVGRKFNLERRCLSAVVSFQSLLSAASCMKIRWRLFRATCIISVSSKSWVFRNIGIWKLIGARST